MRNDQCVDFLYRLTSYCFAEGDITFEWSKCIIKPIPKAGSSDAREPLNYRGISLLSVPYKIYADILNHRLSKWLESNGILCDEQNGFRRERSCQEHIYTLYTIVNNRKLARQSTLSCFIDLRKAYDSISRECLWYKLLSVGINGKMFDAIKSLYNAVQCTVNVNDMFSPWFTVNTGLKQGCKISTSLFSVYVNDLIIEIKNLNCGIQIDDKMVSILAYADDLVLMAPTAESLQNMLDVVYKWCSKWRLAVNEDKTKIVHFRPPSFERCSYNFTCGPSLIQYESCYKYLGIWLNEHLNMAKTVTEITKSSSRALSALYTKCLQAGGVTYNVFTKLYESLVEPVMLYSASIWGVGIAEQKKIQTVQNKACRYFLGGAKHASNVALRGDMGWTSANVNIKTEVFRSYMKLGRLPSSRLVKHVHDWSKQINRSWESRVLKLAQSCECSPIVTNDSKSIKLLVKELKQSLSVTDAIVWENELVKSEKLRTYKQYKCVLETEHYCKIPLSRDQRRTLFK